MWDYLIENGFVVDGSGAPGITADVAIRDNKIAALGRELCGEAKQVVDAAGLLVTPGFMDMHSHADRTILANPNCESALRQGITFALGGQCGGSAAPLTPETQKQMQERRPDTDWLSLDDFFARLERERMGIKQSLLHQWKTDSIFDKFL